MRTDIPHMILNNWEQAEEQKIAMEVLQRKDRAGRVEAEKRRK